MKKRTPATLEIRHPIETNDSLDRLQERAWDLFGASFNFFDIDTCSVVVVDQSEVRETLAQSQKRLLEFRAKVTARQIRESAPLSFISTTTVSPSGLIIRRAEGVQRGQRFLAATFNDPHLRTERARALEEIDLSMNHRNSWNNDFMPFADLAKVEYIPKDPEALVDLNSTPIEPTTLLPGQVVVLTIDS